MAERIKMSPEIEAKRAAIVVAGGNCWSGQWKVHEPHEYELHLSAWLGGGTEMIRCPGKTEETVLR